MSDTPDFQEDMPTPTKPPPHKWYSLHALLPVLATLGTAFVAVAIVLPSIIAARAPETEGEHSEEISETVEATLPVTEASTDVAIVSTDVPTTRPETTDEPAATLATRTPADLAIVSTDEPAATSTLAPTDAPATTASTQKASEIPSTVAATATRLSPTSTAIPPTATPMGDPNVTLFYDQDAFTIYNMSDDHVSLEGVSFRGEDATWEVATFGSMVEALPKNRCLRIRNAEVGNRTPPAECGGQFLGFLEIGAEEIFWRGDSFDVLRDEVVVATCPNDGGRCEVFIEPKRG